MSSCILCMIAKKEAPASVLYEDGEVMAFLDTNPIQRGHTLVIPKSHSVDIWDIEPEVLSNIVRIAKEVSKKMAIALKTEGINTFSASGKPARQGINHFHLHVIPFGKGERSKFAEWWRSKASRAERSDLDELARKLRI